MFRNTKADPPKTGPAFGAWSGRDIVFSTLPGGGVVQFDLSKLTLEDFRSMRDHYQVNASLAVLSFLQHQSDWHLVGDDKKITSFCEDQLRENWTKLNRGLATANWAGYSPMALEWDNNYDTRSIDLSKVKDLVPEECRVNWKEVEGWAPPGRLKPKFKIYDGIKHQATPGWPIPVDNTLWYPLLMENGDYYGRKLLRPAFTSWFFSILVHLFANRYYERFGEPTPIGRAPFDEEIDIDGTPVRGNTFMLNLLQQLRNRSVVVLPNDRTQDENGKPSFDYNMEYLESQMRGADFERYMTRLDEEISIGLFTPILLLRTADVGSYNLGVGHLQVYQWMLNAMNDDRAQYINQYLLRKMTDFNFSPKAPSPKIVFRKMGNTNADMISALIQALLKSNKIKLDLDELGQMSGMTLKEVRQTTAPDATPGTGPDTGGGDGAGSGGGDGNGPASGAGGSNILSSMTAATLREIKTRVRPQIVNAFDGKNTGKINMGYRNRMEKAMAADGVSSARENTAALYDKMDRWLEDVMPIADEFSSSDELFNLFDKALDTTAASLATA
jgi:hypothetical protein